MHMIRLLPDGILIGYGVWLLWLLLPVPGTVLGMFLWYLARYLFDLRHPVQRRLKAALAEQLAEVNRWKAEWADEHRAREAAEAKRNELQIRRV
jgi:hypothetical protein